MLPCQIEETTLSKSKFLYDVDRKKIVDSANNFQELYFI